VPTFKLFSSTSTTAVVIDLMRIMSEIFSVCMTEILFQDDQDQSATEPREGIRFHSVRWPGVQSADRR